jgi:hypothetical protein
MLLRHRSRRCGSSGQCSWDTAPTEHLTTRLKPLLEELELEPGLLLSSGYYRNGALLALAVTQATCLCQYLDSLKDLGVRKVVSVAVFLGFAHGLTALAFPLVVPSNLLYTREHNVQGQVQILKPSW